MNDAGYHIITTCSFVNGDVQWRDKKMLRHLLSTLNCASEATSSSTTMAREVAASESGMLYRPRRRLSPASATCAASTLTWQMAGIVKQELFAITTGVGPYLGATVMTTLGAQTSHASEDIRGRCTTNSLHGVSLRRRPPCRGRWCRPDPRSASALEPEPLPHHSKACPIHRSSALSAGCQLHTSIVDGPAATVSH